MEPKVSVIIPTIDRPELERAVASVKAQTFPDYELIVEHDPTRTGSSATRNRGYLKSKGKYVIFLDDDNEFLPDLLKEAVYLLDHAPPEVGGVRVGRIIKYKDFEDYAAPTTHTGFDSIDWGFLMRREVLENIKYDENIFGDEDADFGIEFAKRYKQIPIDKPLSIAHAESDEGSVCMPSTKRLQGLRYFINKHLGHYKQHPNELRYLYRLAGRNFFRAGYKSAGRHYFWLSFLADPSYKSFLHYFYILQGWRAYDRFMDREEKKGAKLRTTK